MKFCPLCHSEFEDGLTECPDCSQELLNGMSEENPIFFVSPDEELVLKLYNYLCEQEVPEVQYYYDAHSLSYAITVPSAESINAMQIILLENANVADSAFSAKERESIETYFSDDVKELHTDEGGKTFINAREKYSDVFSSAVCLIVVSVLGFAFIALSALKVIPLDFGMLFYIFSSMMFLIFLVIGISTMSSAMKIKASISEEDVMSDNIKEYLGSDYTPLDAAEEDTDISPEELYYTRTEHMRQCVTERFPEADSLLVDALIEDAYSNLYPEEAAEEE